MQHHFIVYFNTLTNEWVVESNMDSFLNDGTVWDDSISEWVHAIDDGDTYAKDEELYDTLNAVFNTLNKGETK
jgi:hypothetical protein